MSSGGLQVKAVQVKAALPGSEPPPASSLLVQVWTLLNPGDGIGADETRGVSVLF